MVERGKIEKIKIKFGNFNFYNFDFKEYHLIDKFRISFEYKRTMKKGKILENGIMLIYNFNLTIHPKCEMTFDGDCIIHTDSPEILFKVYKSEKRSMTRKKNFNLISAINKFILFNCFLNCKNEMEKIGMIFPNFDNLIDEIGVRVISEVKNNTNKEDEKKKIK